MVGYWLPIGIGRVHEVFPDFPLRTLLSRGQIESKVWLLKQTLAIGWTDLGTVYLCAGWVGSMATLIFDEPRLRVERVLSFDTDENVIAIAELLNRPFVSDFHKFKAVKMDILDLNYSNDIFELPDTQWNFQSRAISPSTVINTSCEHISDFANWWAKVPTGTRVILQSNNEPRYPGHINCVRSLEEFRASAPMANLVYAGERQVFDFTRYMLMGTK